MRTRALSRRNALAMVGVVAACIAMAVAASNLLVPSAPIVRSASTASGSSPPSEPPPPQSSVPRPALNGPEASGPNGPDDRAVEAPCQVTVVACVQLSTQHIWLLDERGRVVRDGFVSSGADGEETPTGLFTVGWKNRDHVSGESGVAMPFSVFFTDRGHALHEGSLSTESAGCVRLTRADAVAFFDALQPGDRVQILP